MSFVISNLRTPLISLLRPIVQHICWPQALWAFTPFHAASGLRTFRTPSFLYLEFRDYPAKGRKLARIVKVEQAAHLQQKQRLSSLLNRRIGSILATQKPMCPGKCIWSKGTGIGGLTAFYWELQVEKVMDRSTYLYHVIPSFCRGPAKL